MTIEQEARQSLAVLGLAFRIKDGQQIDADTWRELDRQARRIIECVTFQEPPRTGPVYPWLRIDKLHGNPNSSGYVVEFKAPELVYWLPKADFGLLHDLEVRLAETSGAYPLPAEEREWIDAPAVGKELI